MIGPERRWIREGIRERERDPETLFGMCLHPASQSDLSLYCLILPLSSPLFSSCLSVCTVYPDAAARLRVTSHCLGAVNSIMSKQLQYTVYVVKKTVVFLERSLAVT